MKDKPVSNRERIYLHTQLNSELEKLAHSLKESKQQYSLQDFLSFQKEQQSILNLIHDINQRIQYTMTKRKNTTKKLNLA